jgi:hypothetical protein
MPRMKTPPPFSENDRIKVLLWCSRHCCLCGKFVGIGIELHHIDKMSSDIDNAPPVCFDCHAAIGHYNDLAPRGRKYDSRELKERRNQVYEQHTRHLVPPVRYEITQRIPNSTEKRKLPDVGFRIENLGDLHPIRARIWVTVGRGKQSCGHPSTAGHYNGQYFWNLNPRAGVSGHFGLPPAALENNAEPITTRIDVKLYDIYEYTHKLLPVGYVYDRANDDWYLEPSAEALSEAPRSLI